MSSILSYYLLIAFASSFVVAHIEEDVSYHDIREGGIVKYLIRPLSYYWFKFFEEIRFRILQGSYVIITILVIRIVFGKIITITTDPTLFFMAMLSIMAAFVLSFTFKMVIGLLAFWVTDISSLLQLVEVIFIICAGFIVPLDFFPTWLWKTTSVLPFAYIVYYPVTILQGRIEGVNLLSVFVGQIIWILILGLLYQFLWKKGVRMFSGVGQ